LRYVVFAGKPTPLGDRNIHLPFSERSGSEG
jgi:hypothetical protein